MKLSTEDGYHQPDVWTYEIDERELIELLLRHIETLDIGLPKDEFIVKKYIKMYPMGDNYYYGLTCLVACDCHRCLNP